jgi:hypothetical protein
MPSFASASSVFSFRVRILELQQAHRPGYLKTAEPGRPIVEGRTADPLRAACMGHGGELLSAELAAPHSVGPLP